MALTRIEENLARAVFTKHMSQEFALGVYERDFGNMNNPSKYTGSGYNLAIGQGVKLPIDYSNSTASVYNVRQTYSYDTKTLTCQSKVPGLDIDNFLLAIDEYIELSRQRAFEILADDKGIRNE